MNEAQRSLRPPSSTTVCLRPRPLVLAAVRPVCRRANCATRRLYGRGGAPSVDRRVQNQTGREVRSGPRPVHAQCNPVGRGPCIEIEAAQGRGHGHRRRLDPRRSPRRGRRARRVNAVLALRDGMLSTTQDPPSTNPSHDTEGRLDAGIDPSQLPRRRSCTRPRSGRRTRCAGESNADNEATTPKRAGSSCAKLG